MKLRLTPAAEADVRDINGWYPYAVFYVVGDTEIGVLGTFHGRRDPKVWKSRYDP